VALEDELAKETVSSIKTKIDKYQKKRKHLAELIKTMTEEGKKQLTITDPESRAMKNNGKIDVAYNMQSVVDGKHKLIVTLDVVNDENDQSQLSPMTFQINEILSKHKGRVFVADTGYNNAKEIKNCLDERSQIVEHPFGTIKQSFGYTYFLCKGLDSVDAEAALIGVAYNLKRLTKIKKVSEIVELLAA
jgi:hypothetical protein